MTSYLFIFVALFSFNACRIPSPSSLSDTNPTKLFEFGWSATPCKTPRVLLDPLRPDMVVSILNGSIEGWDVLQRRQSFQWTSPNHGDSFNDGFLLADGKQLLLAGSDGITQAELSTGKTIAEYNLPQGIPNYAYYSVVAGSDSRIAAAVGASILRENLPDPVYIGVSTHGGDTARKQIEQEIVLLDLETHKIISTINFTDSFVHSVRFSRDQRFIITTSYFRVRFWNLTDPHNIKLENEFKYEDFGVSGSSNSFFVATAISDDLRLMTVSTRTVLFVIDTESRRVIPGLHWENTDRVFFPRYLQWANSGVEFMGSDLQGHFYKWSIAASQITYLGYATLGPGSENGVLIDLNNPAPHPQFAIDFGGRYFVRLGYVAIENYPGCGGFEVFKLPE